MLDGRKVFCIGFNKTGVKTLEHLLREQLGLRVTSDPKWTYWSHTGALDDLMGFDAFVDGECADVAWLDRRFPGARFVLNTRRLDRWLASRHLAVERSRRLARWVVDRLAVGTPAAVEARFLDNGPAALGRWVRIRNSYHAHVLAHFAGRSDALAVVDFESEGDEAFARLQSFLGSRRPLSRVHRNVRGDGTRTGRMYAALFGDQDRLAAASAAEAGQFIERAGLSAHAHVSTVIDDPQWFLEANAVDRVLDRVPALGVWQERLLSRACRVRSRAQGVVTSYCADRLIQLCRTQSRMQAFVPVDRYASSSR